MADFGEFRNEPYKMNSDAIRDRFQKSRPNSMCDKADMVPVDGNGGGVAAPAATSTDASAAAANGEKGEGAAKG